MKRNLAFVLAVVLAIGLTVPTAHSAVTPGTKCARVGMQQVYKGKTYTCIKLGKKLYWNNGVVVKATPTPTPTPPPTPTPTPTVTPRPSQSPPRPLLRGADISFQSAKLTVTWSGMGVDQAPLLNLRRLNLWILDSQINPLVGPLWRVAAFIAPNPGASVEITLPPRAHSVRISAVLLSGEETGYSTTIIAVPNPVKLSKPADVVAEWEKTDFKISFSHNSNEEYLFAYRIRLDAGGSSKILDIKPSKSSTKQSFILNLQGNQSLFGPPQTVISGSVRTVDIFGNEGEEVRFPAPVYKSSLPSP